MKIASNLQRNEPVAHPFGCNFTLAESQTGWHGLSFCRPNVILAPMNETHQRDLVKLLDGWSILDGLMRIAQYFEWSVI
jgi:hypothetical protein